MKTGPKHDYKELRCALNRGLISSREENQGRLEASGQLIKVTLKELERRTKTLLLFLGGLKNVIVAAFCLPR